ncbi:MAG: hypothetical protein AB7O04_16435 [Hyphomonadaceae bacterium]
MMRTFLFFTLAFAAACAQPPAGRCDFTATRQIAFTSADAQDRITVRSFGASCDKAIGVYEIVDAEDRPIWAWATPLQRAFGDVFAADEPEQMRTFLQEWSQPTVMSTQAAPEWSALVPGQTTFDQLTYADIRARNLPMLCHFSGTARQTCVFWEPVAGGAGHLFDRDVEETAE